MLAPYGGLRRWVALSPRLARSTGASTAELIAPASIKFCAAARGDPPSKQSPGLDQILCCNRSLLLGRRFQRESSALAQDAVASPSVLSVASCGGWGPVHRAGRKTPLRGGPNLVATQVSIDRAVAIRLPVGVRAGRPCVTDVRAAH